MKQLFDSKGNIEPWGRDIFSHNPIVEMIIILTGTAVTGAVILGVCLGIAFLLVKFFN